MSYVYVLTLSYCLQFIEPQCVTQIHKNFVLNSKELCIKKQTQYKNEPYVTVVQECKKSPKEFFK